MGEVTDQEAGGKLVEYARVHNSDCDMVHSDVRALQEEEAVAHDSEAHVCFRVASISELILIENYLAIVKDRVVRAQHVGRNLWHLRALVEVCSELLLLRNLADNLCPQLLRQGELFGELIKRLLHRSNRTLVGRREGPVCGLSDDREVFDFAHILLLPCAGATCLYLIRYYVNCVQLSNFLLARCICGRVFLLLLSLIPAIKSFRPLVELAQLETI